MGKKEVLRYKDSPFRDDMVVPVGHKLLKVMDGKKDKTVLVNIESGEEMMTGVFTYKKVDNDTFVKSFTQNIAITHNLGLAGRRACDILQWVIQDHAINKDSVWLGLQVLDDWNARDDIIKKVSKSSWYRGVDELIEGGIIARKDSGRQADYWLNPNIMFNGNRLVLTTMIERDSNLLEGEIVPDLTEDKQLDLLK
jgi:hypothetical protein